MAAKKPKMNLGPIDDNLRKIIMKAVKKANKSRDVGGVKKPKPQPAKVQKTRKEMTAAERYDARELRRGPSLSSADRQLGTSGLLRRADDMLKSMEVNKRIAEKDDVIYAIREKKNNPITQKQFNKAKKRNKGNNKNAPKFFGKPEGEMIAAQAKKEKRALERKAAGGVNAPERVAQRRQKRDDLRKAARAAAKERNKRKK